MKQEQEVINAFTKFIKGGDESDLNALEDILHENYRNVQYNFFDKEGVFVINKSEYINLIRDKVFGGIHRDITIESINVHGRIAMVKVRLESAKMIFVSYISLINDNSWKVIKNFPHVEYKSL